MQIRILLFSLVVVMGLAVADFEQTWNSFTDWTWGPCVNEQGAICDQETSFSNGAWLEWHWHEYGWGGVVKGHRDASRAFYWDGAKCAPYFQGASLQFRWNSSREDFDGGYSYTSLSVKLVEPSGEEHLLWSKSYGEGVGCTHWMSENIYIPKDHLDSTGWYQLVFSSSAQLDKNPWWYDTERVRWMVDDVALAINTNGGLQVWSDAGGESVFIDGSYEGTASAGWTKMLVEEGWHSIKVSKNCYRDFEGSVRVDPCQDASIVPSLIPIGEIQISTTPTGAMLYMGNEYKGTTPLRLSDIEINKEIQLRVSKECYKSYSRTVTLTAPCQREDVQISLTPLGSIEVSSTPTAKVYLNGVYRGDTPLVLSCLEDGTYEVKLSAEGYKDYTESVSLSAGEVKKISANLVGVGKLTITSNPSGASVYINGNYRGSTPLTLQLEEGRYTLRIAKSGYREYTESVSITPLGEREISAKLVGIGEISVFTSPGGASVYLDGDYKCTSPCTIGDVIEGEHHVKVIKGRYKEWETRVKVSAGGSFPISASLEPYLGSLIINSDPSSASVFIDGTFAGMTPLTVKVSSLPHTVTIKKEGYLDYSENVDVLPNSANTISAKLVRKPFVVSIFEWIINWIKTVFRVR